MVLDPMSMRARGCGPSEGLLRTPSAGTQKKRFEAGDGILGVLVAALPPTFTPSCPLEVGIGESHDD